MKKFLLSILLVVMCAATVFSGCNLVQTDSTAFADGVCAEVDGVTVTRRELVNYYVSARNSGYSFTVKELLEEIINQKLIIREVKNNFADYISAIQQNEDMPQANKGLDNNTVSDTTHYLKNIKNKYYYNDVMRKVFDALDSEILEYENSIRVARGDKKLEAKEDEEIKTDYDAEKLYEDVFKLEGDQIVKTYNATEFESVAIDYTTYHYTSEGLASDQQNAYNRFISGLIRNEKGKNLDKNADNVFAREVERLYKIYEEQELQNIFKEKYLRTLNVDVKAVVSKYQELVKNSYSKIYSDGATDEQIRATYVKMMKDSASTTYYHPYANTEKGYIQVAHILIKFTDEQIKGEDNANSLKNILQIEDAAEREAALDNWTKNCYGKERYTSENEDKDAGKYAGNEFGDDILYYSDDTSVTTIYSIIQEALAGKTTTQKAEIINDLAYRFGQDTGMINPKGYYAVSLDTSIYDDENKEGLEKAFADEARRLYNEVGVGAISGPIYVNQYIDEDGNYNENGNYAGYHFIFVVGQYDNLFDYETEIEDLADDDKYMDNAITLLNTRVMLGIEEKSLFDQIYDSITTYDYTTAREDKIATILNGKSITYNDAYFKDLSDNNQ